MFSMSQERGEWILCVTTYEKGQSFMRQCAAMGCRVLLLTLNKHRNADWPHDILEEVVYMPDGLTLEQVTNTVTYLARSRRFDRLVAWTNSIWRRLRISGSTCTFRAWG